MSILKTPVYMVVQFAGQDEHSIGQDDFVEHMKSVLRIAQEADASSFQSITIKLSRRVIKSLGDAKPSDEEQVAAALTQHAMDEDEFRRTMDPEQLAYFDATQAYADDPMFKQFMMNCRAKNREYLTPGEWQHIMQYAMTHFPLAYDRMRQGFNGPPRPDSVI